MPAVPRATATFSTLPTLAATSQPLVVRGLDLGTLSPSDFATDLPHQPLEGGVETSFAPRIVYYGGNKPIARVRGFEKWRSGVQRVLHLSAAGLLRRLHAADAALYWPSEADDHCAARTFYSYSAPNSTAAVNVTHRYLRTADLAAAATRIASATPAPHRPRTPTPIVPIAPPHAEPLAHSLNLWLGGGGSTSAAHYDASLNLFAQLHGTKRWLLAPPTAEADLEPFSFLHPHSRRAQRPISAAYDFTLSENELLVLPPFWWHEVTATSAVSLSLNVWASVPPMLAVQRLMGAPARAIGAHNGSGGLFEDGAFTREARTAALAQLLVALVAASLAIPPLAARAWLATSMASRWRDVVARYPRPMAILAKFCAPAAAAGRAALVDAALEASPPLAWERAQAAVADAAAAVRALPAGGRELELGNLVEEAALAVLGDPKLAGAFLVACFAPDE